MTVGGTVVLYPLNITPEISFIRNFHLKVLKKGTVLYKSVKVKATAEVKVV